MQSARLSRNSTLHVAQETKFKVAHEARVVVVKAAAQDVVVITCRLHAFNVLQRRTS